MLTADDLRSDLSAFSDSDDDLIIDPSGSILLMRGGRELQCRYDNASGQDLIEVDTRVMPYRDFLVHYLGQLEVFAERLLSRRSDESVFVDGPARLDSVEEGFRSGKELTLLREEADSGAALTARVCFITADAGHGKTALLRQYQTRCARAFLQNQSTYLFWHVDLQGRQLVRLSEALMGDLGELRIPGLWMPAIIRLLQHRALVLAIDGFDELAAEQGSADALGALALLVQQLDGRGIIVAASRRTFFDTEEYLKRSSLFRRSLAVPCQFDQIQLSPWMRSDAIDYLSQCTVEGRSFDDPERQYEEIVEALGGDGTHPMITRPFLFTHIANGLLRYQVAARDFVKPTDDPMGGVEEVINAFVDREVASKWRFRDTNEPYLSPDQHIRLLSDVAEEMYRAQKDRLDVDVIETIAGMLLEELELDPLRRRQVIDMVRMHVLLTIPADGDARKRTFDHPEFRDYFIAAALRGHIERAIESGSSWELARYLSIAQLSDSTARYVKRMVDLAHGRARILVGLLESIVRAERKPTNVQGNVGTLVAAVLDGLEPSGEMLFDGAAIITSVVLERTRFSDVALTRCLLVNASMRGVEWRNVTLSDCVVGQVTIDEGARFENVVLRRCSVDSVRVMQGEEELGREYAPSRVRSLLASRGVSVAEGTGTRVEDLDKAREVESDLSKVVHKVLRTFSRATVVNDILLRRKYRQDQHAIFNTVMPLLVECGIVKPDVWRGSGDGTRVWAIQYPLDQVMAAEEGHGTEGLVRFWERVAAGG